MGQRASSQHRIWEKSKNVALVMKKPSKISYNDLGIMDFCVWGLLGHINLPGKNERNLPCSFQDRPIATAWQLTPELGPGETNNVFLSFLT